MDTSWSHLQALKFAFQFKGETMPRKCQQLETAILRRPPKEWCRQMRLLQDLRCCRKWIHCVLRHGNRIWGGLDTRYVMELQKQAILEF